MGCDTYRVTPEPCTKAHTLNQRCDGGTKLAWRSRNDFTVSSDSACRGDIEVRITRGYESRSNKPSRRP